MRNNEIEDRLDEIESNTRAIYRDMPDSGMMGFVMFFIVVLAVMGVVIIILLAQIAINTHQPVHITNSTDYSSSNQLTAINWCNRFNQTYLSYDTLKCANGEMQVRCFSSQVSQEVKYCVQTVN